MNKMNIIMLKIKKLHFFQMPEDTDLPPIQLELFNQELPPIETSADHVSSDDLITDLDQ